MNFLAKLKSANALVISFAEHNGSYSAAYKNLFDWASRINTKVFQNKPTIFLASYQGRAARVVFWLPPLSLRHYLRHTLKAPFLCLVSTTTLT